MLSIFRLSKKMTMMCRQQWKFNKMQQKGAMMTWNIILKVSSPGHWLLKFTIKILFQEFFFRVSTIEMEDSRNQKKLDMQIVSFLMRTMPIFVICIIQSKIIKSKPFQNLSKNRGKMLFLVINNNKKRVFNLLKYMMKIEFLTDWI